MDILISTETDITRSQIRYMSAFLFLTSSSVGIGFLFLPHLCHEIGMLIMLAVLVVTCLGSLFGSYLIVNAYKFYKSESYPDLVFQILGKKNYVAMIFLLSLWITFSTTIYIYYGFIISQRAPVTSSAEVWRSADLRAGLLHLRKRHFGTVRFHLLAIRFPSHSVDKLLFQLFQRPFILDSPVPDAKILPEHDSGPSYQLFQFWHKHLYGHRHVLFRLLEPLFNGHNNKNPKERLDHFEIQGELSRRSFGRSICLWHCMLSPATPGTCHLARKFLTSLQAERH